MKNKADDSMKVLWGVLIGGIVGGGALYLLHSSNTYKKPVLDKIGKAISEMGDILESSRVEDSCEAIERIEKTIPRGENAINNVLTWVATGINLWTKLNKRG